MSSIVIPFPAYSRASLWIYFALTLILSAGFLIGMSIYDFVIIDEIYRPAQIQAHVEAMTPLQRRVHIIMTATLDVAYPFAYGGLLAGLAHTAFPARRWLAGPILLCIPVDLLEGVSQILILSGQTDWIGVKVVVTPVKLGLFLTGLVVGAAALIRLIWLRSSRREPK